MTRIPKKNRAASVIFVCLLAARSADCTELSDEELFESRIRPVLVNVCFRCHGGEKVSGGLRVDSRSALVIGGDTGSALALNDARESRIVKALRREDDVSAMPPDKPLDARTVDAFATWVERGAPWPGSTRKFQVQRHWAFEPLPSSPQAADPSERLDQLIQDRLNAQDAVARPPADKRALLRRATLDLTGLPATEDEVERFLRDTSPDAFRRVVEELLARPQYGERWGRHWLDVVRYADTAGENSDHPVPDAWRYRNWVINAFNTDKPYDVFVREQIAGDLLAADLVRDATASQLESLGGTYGDLMVATGYLAIARRFGHDIDKDMYLTMEDVIDTLGKSFLGLTIGCARCHSHKYDPISQDDYYALYGIFDSTRFSFPGCEPKQQPRDLVPLLPRARFDSLVRPYQEQLAVLDSRLKAIQERQSELSKSALVFPPGRELARDRFDDGGQSDLPLSAVQPFAVAPGQLLQLTILPRANYGADTTRIEWEIQEVGGDQRVWNLARDIIPGFAAANPHADQYGNARVWHYLDPRNGVRLLQEPLLNHSGKMGLHVWRTGDNPSVLVNATEEPIAVWTNLPARTVFAHPAPDGGVAIGWVSPIAGEVRLQARIADGHPGGGDGIEWVLEHIAADVATPLTMMGELADQAASVNGERAALVARQPVVEYGYGVTEGEPKNARVHERGDHEKLGKEVPRRWLELFGGPAVTGTTESGRRQLANWITDPDNPLTARVMANRIWQHHFGKGIVKTPNDFGTRGQPPTHPELLDWLAGEFIRSGWSMKHMHRIIMFSRTYQRSSALHGEGLPEPVLSTESDRLIANKSPAITDVDANDLYARFERRRLSAEEIRDGLLFVSGQLDTSAGGPHPFPPQSGWGFSQHNPFSGFVESDRRTVYMMTLRNRRHPFLALFDGADPNGSTPLRQATTVPTQALYFMNDPFVHGCSERLAQMILHSDPTRDDSQCADQLYRRCLGREATDAERHSAIDWVSNYSIELTEGDVSRQRLQAWSAFARVLLASNEFLFAE